MPHRPELTPGGNLVLSRRLAERGRVVIEATDLHGRYRQIVSAAVLMSEDELVRLADEALVAPPRVLEGAA